MKEIKPKTESEFAIHDKNIRSSLSDMLGSFTEKTQYGQYEKIINVLDWPEIFFRLGQKLARLKYSEDVIETQNEVKHLKNEMCKMFDMIDEISSE